MRKVLLIATTLLITLTLQTALIHAENPCDKAVVAYRVLAEDSDADECIAFVTIGYAHGIETGQTGNVVYKSRSGLGNKFATLEVIDTDTYLSICRLVGVTVEEYLREQDVQFECHEWSVKQRLEKAASAFEAEDWTRAQHFYATCRDSSPPDQTDLICDRLDQCAQYVLKERNRKLSRKEKKEQKGKIQRYHELAVHYLLRGDYLAAKEYNDRILRVEKKHKPAKETRALIDRHAAAMVAIDETNKFAGCSIEDTLNTLPDPSEFAPIEIYPAMTYECEAKYPANAKPDGVKGSVWVKSLISKAGKPLRSEIGESSGSEALDFAALKASYGNKYSPGIQNGRPVAVWVTYRVDFDPNR